MISQTESTALAQGAEPVLIAPKKNGRARKNLTRIAMLLLVAYCWGWVVNHLITRANESHTPPGFAVGVLHGAIMPGAMLSLLAGNDVVIYADHNAGRTYKLGYTLGVNACGAFFFGLFYWRLNRLRKFYAKA